MIVGLVHIELGLVVRAADSRIERKALGPEGVQVGEAGRLHVVGVVGPIVIDRRVDTVAEIARADGGDVATGIDIPAHVDVGPNPKLFSARAEAAHRSLRTDSRGIRDRVSAHIQGDSHGVLLGIADIDTRQIRAVQRRIVDADNRHHVTRLRRNRTSRPVGGLSSPAAAGADDVVGREPGHRHLHDEAALGTGQRSHGANRAIRNRRATQADDHAFDASLLVRQNRVDLANDERVRVPIGVVVDEVTIEHAGALHARQRGRRAIRRQGSAVRPTDRDHQRLIRHDRRVLQELWRVCVDVLL